MSRPGAEMHTPHAVERGSEAARILVVEDEQAALSLMVDYLGHRGYRVATASEGAGALAAFESEPADVVITDLKMQGFDGITFIKRLRSAGHAVPVIVVSGAITPGLDEALSQLEVTHVLSKPLRLRTLREAVEACLAGSGTP